MKNAAELVAFISPSIRLSGRRKLIRAIEIVRSLLEAKRSSESIMMTKEVYQPIADEFGCKLGAAERAIYRAIEICWNDGENENVNKIFGQKIPIKPAPRDFMLYCACYLIFGEPYRDSKGNTKFPLIF